MNLFDYLAHENERSREQLRDPGFQQRLRMNLLLLVAVVSALSGALCFEVASHETRTETSGHLWWKTETISQVPMGTRVAWMVAGAVSVLVTLVLVTLAISIVARRAAVKDYAAILTGVEVMKIQEISDITGKNKRRVHKDLQAMIRTGMIEDFYIDYQRQLVVSRKYIPKSSHKTVVVCTGCGGANEVIVGITRTCGFCGQPLVLAAQ